MNKIIVGLIFTLTSLISDSNWPFVCELSDLSWIGGKRYSFVSNGDNDTPAIYIDTKSIQIDQKKKTIKVWTIWVMSPAGRQNINNVLIGNTYSNVGYYQSLYTIDYKSRKKLNLSSTYYNCDGSTLDTDSSSKWTEILPDSVMEEITDNIIEKYNLK